MNDGSGLQSLGFVGSNKEKLVAVFEVGKKWFRQGEQ